jgi:hypothetical protein
VRPLLTLSARWGALATLLVLAVGLAGGLVRLLPWLVAPEVPLGLSAPFARLLFAAASEAALVIGFPVGAGIAAARLVERGEARALGALGVSPGRISAAVMIPGLAIVACAVAVGMSAPTEPPGQLAARLLSEGRRACADPPAARRVDVPIVSLTWLCLESGPRLAGQVPGIAPLWFSTSDVHPGDELRTVGLDDVHLAGRLGSKTVRLRAGQVRIVGLPGWGGSRKLTGPFRGLIMGASALVMALAVSWLVVRRGVPWPLLVALTSGSAAAGTLAVVRALESRSVPLAAFWVVPPLGLAIVSALFSLSAHVAEQRVAWRRAE